MYEGGIKVPACFVWINKIKPFTESDNLALTMDIFPTLCEIAGVHTETQTDGISLLGSLMRNPQITDDRTVYFMRREGGEYGGMSYYAARNSQFKLVQNTPFEPLQLFNIKNDPLEQAPIQNNADEFNKLKNNLSQHIRKSGAVPWQKE